MKKGLSKSRILSGLQCLKRVYLETHRRDLLDERVGATAFDIGNELGELARTLFPGGILIGHDDNLKVAIAETEQYLAKDEDCTLFEATVAYDGVLIRADVLQKTDDVITLIEVKSSTKVKDYYFVDSAVQAWVLRNAGYTLGKVYLAHVDNTFTYQGDNNYQGILKHADITDQVLGLQNEVDDWVATTYDTINGEEPDIDIGTHCNTPFDCPFQSYCHPQPSKYPVTCLPGKGKIVDELLSEGIEDIRDIPEGRLTNALQERVCRITKSGIPELDPKAAEIINSLGYPRYNLDFETVGMVIPRWKGTRPYQALPFQWSCHIEHENGEVVHEEFLDVTGDPPMRKLAESLIEKMGESGPILMYTSFERTVIKNLIKMFPDLSEDLQSLIDRLFDLKPVVKDHYYHPDMQGSWSIKYVLPTIAPELSYKDIGEVQDGMAASRAMIEIMNPNTSSERKGLLRNNLLKYCELDTLAMVILLRGLIKE